MLHQEDDTQTKRNKNTDRSKWSQIPPRLLTSHTCKHLITRTWNPSHPRRLSLSDRRCARLEQSETSSGWECIEGDQAHGNQDGSQRAPMSKTIWSSAVNSRCYNTSNVTNGLLDANGCGTSIVWSHVVVYPWRIISIYLSNARISFDLQTPLRPGPQ